MIDTLKANTVWYNAFLEKYADPDSEHHLVDSDHVNHNTVDEYKKLKAQHRQKIVAKLAEKD